MAATQPPPLFPLHHRPWQWTPGWIVPAADRRRPGHRSFSIDRYRDYQIQFDANSVVPGW